MEPAELMTPEEAMDAQAVAPEVDSGEPNVVSAPPASECAEPPVPAAPRVYQTRRPAARIAPPILENRVPGVNVSRQLYEMAGFPRDQAIGSVGAR
jgi:hypothetical protein